MKSTESRTLLWKVVTQFVFDIFHRSTFSLGMKERLLDASDVAEDIGLSLFSDLERVQMELRRLSQSHETESAAMWKFRRVAEDELARMWDNVTELQESANVTSHHVEDIYDKDVVALQDFRAEAQNELKRLRDDLEAIALLREIDHGDGAAEDEGESKSVGLNSKGII